MKRTTKKLFIYNDLHGRNSVPVEDIVRIQSASNYVQIFLFNGKCIMPYMQLKDVRKILCKNNSFLWIHRSHIVNIAYVKKIVKGQTHMQYLAVLTSGQPVPVRRPCVRELREIIDSFQKTSLPGELRNSAMSKNNIGE